MVLPAAFLALLLASPPRDDLADALKLLDAKQPAQAEPLLRKAIETEPTDYFAHFNLALALSLQQKDAEAAAEYRKTLELKPGLYEADLNLGTLLLRDKQFADAVPVLKEAAEARPKEPRPALYYAQALLDSGDAAEAESRFAALILQDPKLAAAQLGLARAYFAQSKLPEAAQQFRAAADQNGLLQVAAAYEKSGDQPAAIAIYKEFPNDPAVREHLGRLQVDANDAAAAIPNLEDAVRKSPNTANRLALADAYRLAKQPAKMLDQLQLAAASDAGNFDLHMAYGRALRDNHNLIPAAQQFLAATKIRPDAVPAWNELASALIVGENYPAGLAALDRIRALGKEIPGDYFLRAITLDKLKQRPEAIAAYKQFLSADGGNHPDQEFQARQRVRIISSELKK
jgi:Tfp pilus assembly protein PilF